MWVIDISESLDLKYSLNDRLTVNTFLNSICKLHPSRNFQFTFTLLFISIGSLSLSQHIPFPEHMTKFTSSAKVELDKKSRFLYILNKQLRWSIFCSNFRSGYLKFSELRQSTSFLWSFSQGWIKEKKTVSSWCFVVCCFCFLF